MPAQARFRLQSQPVSSPRAQRRLEQEARIETENARACLFSGLILISSVLSRVFPEDRQKEAQVILREITDRIRRLRGMLD